MKLLKKEDIAGSVNVELLTIEPDGVGSIIDVACLPEESPGVAVKVELSVTTGLGIFTSDEETFVCERVTYILKNDDGKAEVDVNDDGDGEDDDTSRRLVITSLDNEVCKELIADSLAESTVELRKDLSAVKLEVTTWIPLDGRIRDKRVVTIFTDGTAVELSFADIFKCFDDVNDSLCVERGLDCWVDVNERIMDGSWLLLGNVKVVNKIVGVAEKAVVNDNEAISVPRTTCKDRKDSTISVHYLL